MLSRIKSAFYQAISYPVILLGVALGVIAILLLMVIPQFAAMFSKFNTALPRLTQGLLDLSYFLQNYFWLLVIIALTCTLGIKLILNLSYGCKQKVHMLVLRLPFIGKILKDFNLARFASIMHLLLSADIKIIPALEISAKTLGNIYLKNKILNLKQLINEGLSLADIIKSSDEFSEYARQMLAVGEETGKLAKAFGKISDYHQKRIEAFTLRLKTFLEPALIIFVSLIIGIILFGMYQPIFKLNQLF